MKQLTVIFFFLLALYACEKKVAYITFDIPPPYGSNNGNISSIEETTFGSIQEGDSLMQNAEIESVESIGYSKNGLLDSRTYTFMGLSSTEKHVYNKEKKLTKRTMQVGTSDESTVLETNYIYIDEENAYHITTSSAGASQRDSTHLFYHVATRSTTAIGKDDAGATSTTVLYYDTRGRVIERDYKSSRGKSRNAKMFYDDMDLKSHEIIVDSQGTRAIVLYQYSEFDEQENWTRRESLLEERIISVVKRKIVYR